MVPRHHSPREPTGRAGEQEKCLLSWIVEWSGVEGRGKQLLSPWQMLSIYFPPTFHILFHTSACPSEAPRELPWAAL